MSLSHAFNTAASNGAPARPAVPIKRVIKTPVDAKKFHAKKRVTTPVNVGKARKKDDTGGGKPK